MDTSTVTDDLQEFTPYPDCSREQQFNKWFPFAVCITGILGNSLILIIIQIGYERTPMNSLLKALAVADSSYLLLELLTEILGMFESINMDISFACWDLAKIAQYSSVWHLVMVAGIRFIAVSYPMKASRICTYTRVYTAISVIWVSSIILHLPSILSQ